MDLKKYIKIESGNNILKLKIVPKSKNDGIFGEMSDGSLKIKIKSAPENGKANKELINLISKNLKIPKNNMEIISGELSGNKIIKIDF